MENLAYREICLSREVETSIKLLKKGMGDLQKISGSNDFHHAPILLLSSGYERLIKCLLCLASMDENGKIEGIPFKEGRKGHDIDYLLRKLLSVCEQKNYSSKFPAAKADIDLLSKDKDLRKIISLLSDFAQGGRYYNLNMVLRGTSTDKDPDEGWDKIVNTIVQRREYLLKELHNGDSDYFYKEINRELVITLEKFARSLARLFTLADFGDFAKRASPLVFDYLMLMDNDLGTKEY
ncbi:MAG: hypothetical protein ACXQS5_07140 [Candidatus Methanospirareceae archaeon]